MQYLFCIINNVTNCIGLSQNALNQEFSSLGITRRASGAWPDTWCHLASNQPQSSARGKPLLNSRVQTKTSRNQKSIVEFKRPNAGKPRVLLVLFFMSRGLCVLSPVLTAAVLAAVAAQAANDRLEDLLDDGDDVAGKTVSLKDGLDDVVEGAAVALDDGAEDVVEADGFEQTADDVVEATPEKAAVAITQDATEQAAVVTIQDAAEQVAEQATTSASTDQAGVGWVGTGEGGQGQEQTEGQCYAGHGAGR